MLPDSDAGMVFESLEHMQLGARLLKGHLACFALEMHCGLADADGQVKVKSKTEAVYSPHTPHAPLLMMTSRLFVWTTTVALSRSPSAFDT